MSDGKDDVQPKQPKQPNRFLNLFRRDIDRDIHVIVPSIAQCIMSFFLASFTFTLITSGNPYLENPMFFTTTVKNIFYVLAFLGILVGGAFIDSTSRIQRIQNMINTLVVLCSVVIYYAQRWYTIYLAAINFFWLVFT